MKLLGRRGGDFWRHGEADLVIRPHVERVSKIEEKSEVRNEI